MQRTSGIYQILHVASGKRYIGSAVDIEKRWREHRRTLRKGEHHSRYLQRAWHLHGEAAFVFSLIEIVEDATNLVGREQAYLDQRYAEKGSHEYNSSPTAGNTLGTRFPEHTPAQIAYYERLRRQLSPGHIAANTARRGKQSAAQQAANANRRGKPWYPARKAAYKPDRPPTPAQQAYYDRKCGTSWTPAQRSAREQQKDFGQKISAGRRAAHEARGNVLTEKQIAANTARRGKPPTVAQLAYYERLRSKKAQQNSPSTPPGLWDEEPTG